MPRAASVWLDVLPSMAQFRRELRRELEEPVRQSATRAGEQGGEGLMSGLAGKMKAGALAAGAAAGVLVAKGVALEMEKAAASGKLKASLGLSPKDAQKAGNAAGRLYANAVTGSIDEGANAVKAVMSAGLAPEKATTRQLAAIGTKAQDLATLFEVDLGQGANAAGQLIKTGLAKNADEALDVMYRGFQVMGPRADDLADTFNEYSVQFQRMGLDAKTATGLLAQGMQAGARDTDVVADAIKEFTLEGVQGSAKIRDGFKAVHLPAGRMVEMISKGGPQATKALQMTLDALRGMEDPVKRDAAAVNLFGTKSEDMQKALLALDPSTAAAKLGKISGAAKQAGDDLRDNAGVKFEQFKRKALMAIGEATAKYALPALMKLGTFLLTDVLPPVRTVSAWLADHLVPVILGIGSAVGGTIRWFKEWGIWLAPLAVLIGGITLALSAQAIVEGTVIGIMAAYSLASRGIALVTQGWAAAQALLNSVMALNPFVLVAIAVVALGVALVIAWKKSETFRDIVMGVWKVIQTGAMWLWTNGIKPLVDGFMTGMRTLGQWAAWLWTTVLSPVFSAIATGAKILATILAVIVFGPIYLGVKVLGAVFGWLWTAAIQPVFGWIVAGAQLWWTGVKLYFSLVWGGLKTLGGFFKWLWNAAVKPVFGWIVGGAKLWWTGVKLYFSLVWGGLKTVGSWFKWLWNAAVTPAFNGIKSVISTVWNTGIKPVFDRLKSATKSVAGAFDTARGGIKTAWDKVKGIAKTPVKFIIDTVYNGGIVKVWNKVADVFGAPKLDPIKGFARGGVLPGQSSYRQGDDQLVPMRRGEGVAVSEAMRDPYERARLLAVNKAAMQGRSLRPFQGEGFSKGGIFGWVSSAASKTVDLAKSGVDWLKDGVKASAEAGINAVVRPLIDKISGSSSLYRDMVTGIPKRIIKTIIGYSGTADKKLGALGIGGPAFKRGLSWARTQAGKAYQWAGNGNPSWDCSGFLSAIESVIRGQSPHRRWATGAFSGATAPAGWVLNKKSPYQIGITNAGVGHTAGTLNGVNVESRGGDGVVVGSRARSYRDSMFTHRYGFAAKGYADGGKPRPGEIAWVGERGPELVRFGSGSAEVYNHTDSMRMWDGLGARGFAKGTTSASRAKKDVPGDLKDFTKSLTGSASEIAKAATELVKDLKAAGIGGKKLTDAVTAASKKLQDMAKRRDTLSAVIAEAKQAAKDQAKTAADYMGLSNLSGATSISEVLGGMMERQATVSNSESTIAALSKKGLSQDLISQLVAMGPDSQLAGVLAGANPAQIKQLNAMAANGAKLSTSYGRTMADAMYDAGKSASSGFLAGLLADEKALEKAMAQIGADAIKAVRSKSGLDAHSPSRKGEQAGADLGAGLVAGMAAAGPSIESAAARLGAAAVPAGVVPVTSGTSARSTSGGLNGQPLYLVVEDGTVLRAYVSDRVDDALTDVRRAKRSGKK